MDTLWASECGPGMGPNGHPIDIILHTMDTLNVYSVGIQYVVISWGICTTPGWTQKGSKRVPKGVLRPNPHFWGVVFGHTPDRGYKFLHPKSDHFGGTPGITPFGTFWEVPFGPQRIHYIYIRLLCVGYMVYGVSRGCSVACQERGHSWSEVHCNIHPK